MLIFVIVGMPASGKNIARQYAESRKFHYFSTGDIVRAGVQEKGLALTPDNIARVSTELRGDDGLGVTKKALSHALNQEGRFVFLEGMRSLQEIEFIRNQAPCVVIAIVAPRKTRLKRIISRGREDDDPQLFNRRDQREIEYGASVPIALADEYILNTGTPEEALASIHAIVNGYPPENN